jgi:hypothetical protein
MWATLSDERIGLSFIIAAGPRQRSHSRVRVSCDLQPHFTVSDLRLPFSLLPMTRRATVKVFRCYQVANGGNGPPIWRVAANILNKQSLTDNKGWSSSLGVGCGAKNSSP